MFGWWAGPLVWFARAALYDRLFVPKGSVCMGMPFLAPFASIVLLLVFDAVLFLQWLLT